MVRTPGVHAVGKRGQDRHGGVQSRAALARIVPRHRGRVIRKASGAKAAAQGFGHGFRGWVFAVRPLGAKAGNGGVNNRGIDVLQEFIRPTKALKVAGSKIVYYHISFGHQLTKQVSALSMLQIERNALFTGVVEKEKDAIAGRINCLASLPARLARVDRLDLDHVRPHPGQSLGARGASLGFGKFEDSHVLQ